MSFHSSETSTPTTNKQNEIQKNSANHLAIVSKKKEERPNSFGTLPAKILSNIFRHFNEKELIQTISPVCQRWRYAALQPDLWKSLRVVGNNMPTNKICDKIWMFSQLEQIYLKEVPDAPQILRQIGRNLRFLRHLTVRHCELKEDHLRSLIIHCNSIQYLDLKGCHFDASEFYEELSYLRDLKGVNFSNNCRLTMSNLFTAAMNCKSLDEFHLSVFDPIESSKVLGDEDCAFILSTFNGLKRISLDAVYLTNVTFQVLLNCTLLEYLGFYGAQNLTPDIFLRLVQRMPNLEALKIRYAYEIDGDHIKTVFESGRFPKLRELDLTGSKIDDAALEAVAENCPNLQNLVLRSCKRFVDSQPILDKCAHLEQLNVAFCDRFNHDLVLPDNIKVLFVGKTKRCLELARRLTMEKPELMCKICISEYNKDVINYSTFL